MTGPPINLNFQLDREKNFLIMKAVIRIKILAGMEVAISDSVRPLADSVR